MSQVTKFDRTPVRRLYKQKPSAGSGRIAADVLTDKVPLTSEISTLPISDSNGLGYPINTDASSPNLTNKTPSPPPPLSYYFQGPKGPGKDAPARIKANPANEIDIRGVNRSAQLAPLGNSLSSSTGKSQWLDVMNSGFEQELKEIGRINLQLGNNEFEATLNAAKAATISVVEPNIEDEMEPIESKSLSPVHEVGRPIHVPYTPDLRARPGLGTNVHTHVAMKPMVMRDYQLLAEACQRAGKARMEGHAYYKIGELLAQTRDTLSGSVKYFKKYLNICRRLNDLQGEAKALNCLGIAHQELGGKENLTTALHFHQQHSEISDAAGIFIANTNMGLICGQLEDWGRAMEHHKQALQYAVRAGDKQAESLALANLGLMGRSQGDLSTAKVCLERHLELSQNLSDTASASQANEQLGLLAIEKKDWSEASRLLTQAMQLAVQQRDQTKANNMRCLIGVVNGNLKMEEQIRALARNMGAKTEKKDKAKKDG